MLPPGGAPAGGIEGAGAGAGAGAATDGAAGGAGAEPPVVLLKIGFDFYLSPSCICVIKGSIILPSGVERNSSGRLIISSGMFFPKRKLAH